MAEKSTAPASDPPAERILKSDAEWRSELDPARYEVCRGKGTERAFSGEYWDCHEPGVYRCAACGAELFGSDMKFDSGTGWPSFFQPIAEGRVSEALDTSYGMRRTEALCGRCDSHLGHVFEDGPAPTGLRYCINSAALELERKK